MAGAALAATVAQESGGRRRARFQKWQATTLHLYALHLNKKDIIQNGLQCSCSRATFVVDVRALPNPAQLQQDHGRQSEVDVTGGFGEGRFDGQSNAYSLKRFYDEQ